jgi:hypothetical protein
MGIRYALLDSVHFHLRFSQLVTGTMCEARHWYADISSLPYVGLADMLLVRRQPRRVRQVGREPCQIRTVAVLESSLSG